MKLTVGINSHTDISSSAGGYKVSGHVEKTKTGLEIPLSFKQKGRDLFGKTIDDLLVNVDFETEDRLHVKVSRKCGTARSGLVRVRYRRSMILFRKIADKNGKQYLVPDSPLGVERPKIHSAAQDVNYDFKYTSNPFGFKVIRKSDKQVIFDTTDYPLVFEDQYLEVSTTVPKDTNLYGIGEVIGSFRRNNVHVSRTPILR